MKYGGSGVKTLHLKTISALAILTLTMLFHSAYPGHAANDEGRNIYYTLLKGTINNKLADDFAGVLKEAEKANAKVFILEIDTFGGRLDAAVRIKDKLVDTKINTIAFVNKKAISAGALISLATKHIVMAPRKYHRGCHTSKTYLLGRKAGQ